MANNGKSPFSFGSVAGASTGQTPFSGFGSATPSTSSPFGAAQTTTAKPAGSSLFGNLGNGGAVSSVGEAATTGSQAPVFGGAKPSSNPGSGATTPNLFGGSTGPAPGGMFGNKAASSGPANSGTFGSAGSTTLGGAGSLKFAPAKDNNAPAQAGNENKAPATGSGQFGGTANKPSGSGLFNTALSGTTTPAKASFSFPTSTTPAGPPPTDNTQSSKPLFGSLGQPAFGISKPDEPSTLGVTSSLFTNTGVANSTGGVFGSQRPAPTSSGTVSAQTSATSSATPKLTFSLPTSAPASSASSTQPSSTAPAPAPAGSLFSKPPASSLPAHSSFGGFKPVTSAPASASSFFGGTTTKSTSTAPAAATSLFGGLKGNQPQVASSATLTPNTTGGASAPGLFPSSTSTAAPTTSASASSGLGAGLGASSSTSLGAGLGGGPGRESAAGAATLQGGAAPAFGSSTAGPPPQLNRLKNKTMDEIITRWASELSNYQKQFQEQAEKVAGWDRLMVENGDKIQKLYLSTFEAEKQSTEIERQLSNVESQQDELASWLDRYEAEVDDMFQRQVGPGDSLQGPDQERERTYKLAEKLTDRLDDMSKNLASMIDAINDASSTLSKTSKADDPLSHIVRVLNSHLTQLQWIDENASALQNKIAESQKAGQSIGPNGHGGPESEAADSFYRSVMGRK